MASRPTAPISRAQFEIAIVCALPLEYDAVALHIDRFWDEDGDRYGKADGDPNIYTTGRLGGFDVVLVLLPGMGKTNAAAASASLRSSFGSLKLVLLTGICGAVPSTKAINEEITLGDVVISKTVVQYDLRKEYPGHSEMKDTVEDVLGRPNKSIRNLLALFETDLARERLERRAMELVKELQDQAHQKRRGIKYQYPGALQDKLFEPWYRHRHQDRQLCPSKKCHESPDAVCDEALRLSCDDLGCESQHVVARGRHGGVGEMRCRDLEPHRISIFVGNVGSGDTVIKSGLFRETMAIKHGLIAFEMEAAGVWDEIPTIMVKGVCDYADSHKNKRWQDFAAATAASAMKALLERYVRSDRSTEDIDGRITWGIHDHVDPVSSLDWNPTESLSDISVGPSASSDVERMLHKVSELVPGEGRLQLNDRERKQLVDMLAFPQIDSRFANLKNPEAKTCEWFQKKAEYLRWAEGVDLSDHHGFLWLRGKPGVGKSILMKHLLQAEREKQKQDSRFVISFFFNARGNTLEKSIIGLYRALLYQIMMLGPGLADALDWLPYHTAQQILEKGWGLELLKHTFREATKLLKGRRLTIFVDALDECDELEILDMIQVFEEVGTLAYERQDKLQICFSSRHYPNIIINTGLIVILEDEAEHSNDIAKYIQSHLRLGDSPQAAKLRHEMLIKSSGIFLWVSLVIPLLNKTYARGRVDQLQAELRKLPRGLNELFEMIVLRDLENWEEMRICLLILLFARRPLRPEELWFMIKLTVNLETPTRWDPEIIRLEDTVRFAREASKGMAELTKQGDIQFIHESVRDFLLREESQLKLWPEFCHNLSGWGHDVLKQCCEAQIRDFDESLRPKAKRRKTTDGATDPMRDAVQHYALVKYATAYVFIHMNAAQEDGIPQHHFMNNFPLSKWIRLYRVC